MAATGVCRRCARRAWLLARLAEPLDRTARDPTRLWPALELGDAELIEALGGAFRAALREAWERWTPGAKDRRSRQSETVHSVCCHHCAYPRRLRGDALASHAVRVYGGIERLDELMDRKVVAIAGTDSPSDYGLRSAQALAREIAAGGATVAGADDALGMAARVGAAEAGGDSIVVSGHWAYSAQPTACEQAHGATGDRGCLISDLPGGEPHAWVRLASRRTLALVADLVIVVEAGEQALDLASVQVAETRGVPAAVVPGPIDAPTSRGSNALISDGAPILCGGRDVLDALCDIGARRARRRRSPKPRASARRRARGKPATATIFEPGATAEPPATAEPALEPRLASVLERVGRGEDTLAKLCIGEQRCDELALALTQLELLGLLQRVQDGRYRPRAEHLR